VRIAAVAALVWLAPLAFFPVSGRGVERLRDHLGVRLGLLGRARLSNSRVCLGANRRFLGRTRVPRRKRFVFRRIPCYGRGLSVFF